MTQRLTLDQLHNDPKLMLEWLSADGNPPTTMVYTAYGRARSVYGYCPRQEKEVDDEDTLRTWWTEYADALHADWSNSKDNPHRPQTWKQFIGECLRALGFRNGSVEQRRLWAMEENPEVYQPA
jgi:hypothetical protein